MQFFDVIPGNNLYVFNSKLMSFKASVIVKRITLFSRSALSFEICLFCYFFIAWWKQNTESECFIVFSKPFMDLWPRRKVYFVLIVLIYEASNPWYSLWIVFNIDIFHFNNYHIHMLNSIIAFWFSGSFSFFNN